MACSAGIRICVCISSNSNSSLYRRLELKSMKYIYNSIDVRVCEHTHSLLFSSPHPFLLTSFGIDTGIEIRLFCTEIKVRRILIVVIAPLLATRATYSSSGGSSGGGGGDGNSISNDNSK